MCSSNFVLIALFCVFQITTAKPADVEKDDQEFMPLCKSRKHQINPDDLMRKWHPEENWEFDKNFSQRIEGEVCENEGSSCNDFPLMKTKCIQRYLTVQLQIVSKEKKSELKAFPIPSYCECAYLRRRIDDDSKTSPQITPNKD